jgi:segregation and condensation protein B
VNDEIKHIIESLLFVAEAPLSPGRMAEILELENASAVRAALKQLAEEYDRRKGGFYLAEVAGGYQLRSRPEWRAWIQRMLQSGPARLTKASMETLAIIAYKQPVLRSDVEHIRGVDCGGVLRALLERKLIKILGRKEMPGRPLLYGTTRKFLEMFNLKDLKDLPTPKEIALEKSGTDDRPGQEALRFPEAPDGGPEDAADTSPEDRPDRTPDTAPPPPDAVAAPLEDPPSEYLPSEYLPMIIDEAPDAGTDPDAESGPAPDAGPDDDPAPPDDEPGGGAPEKNT